MPKFDRHNEFNSIKDLMRIFVREHKLTKGLQQVNVEEIWLQQMGKGVANYTSKVILRGDILVVHLTSSVLREELSYGKEKIIKILNEALGEELITKIRLL